MEETREEKHERMFFKAVKRRRNEYQPKLNLLKDKQGNIVGEEGKIINRCADHIKNYQRDALKIIYSSNIITPLHVSSIKCSSSGGQSRT